MKVKIGTGAALILGTLFLLSACSQDNTEPVDTKHAAYGNPPFSTPSGSPLIGEGSSFDILDNENRTVEIKLTLAAGYITQVDYGEKTKNHTSAYGQRLLDKAKDQIVSDNSVDGLPDDGRLDATTKASVSTKALKAAFKQAMGTLLD